jgi:hypothetical protein
MTDQLSSVTVYQFTDTECRSPWRPARYYLMTTRTSENAPLPARRSTPVAQGAGHRDLRTVEVTPQPTTGADASARLARFDYVATIAAGGRSDNAR